MVEGANRRNIIAKDSPTKGRWMKWDRKKTIHQELVGEV
jgi:hypothetical protein